MSFEKIRSSIQSIATRTFLVGPGVCRARLRAKTTKATIPENLMPNISATLVQRPIAANKAEDLEFEGPDLIAFRSTNRIHLDCSSVSNPFSARS
jgi:hypothetical protein